MPFTGFSFDNPHRLDAYLGINNMNNLGALPFQGTF